MNKNYVKTILIPNTYVADITQLMCRQTICPRDV